MSDVLERLQEAALRPAGAPYDAPDEPQEGEAPKEAWRVQDLRDAEWAATRLAAARAEEARLLAYAKAQVERIQAAVAAELRRPQATIAYFENQLGAYLEREVQAGRSKKSLTLGAGTVKLTARQPLLVFDDAKLIAWAEANERAELLRVKKEVDKQALKQALKLEQDEDGRRVAVDAATGEVMADVTWEPAPPDSVSFKPKEGDTP